MKNLYRSFKVPVNIFWNTCTDLRGWKDWWRDQGQDWGHEEVNPAKSIFKILDCRGKISFDFFRKQKYHYCDDIMIIRNYFVFTILLFLPRYLIHCRWPLPSYSLRSHTSARVCKSKKVKRLDMIIIKNKRFYLIPKHDRECFEEIYHLKASL